MEDVVLTLGNKTGRAYHRKIFEALQNGDQQKTSEILEEHIQDTIESIKLSEMRPALVEH